MNWGCFCLYSIVCCITFYRENRRQCQKLQLGYNCMNPGILSRGESLSRKGSAPQPTLSLTRSRIDLVTLRDIEKCFALKQWVVTATATTNQSIMGGIRRGARCLAYPTTPSLSVMLSESPCRLPSHTEWLQTGGIDLPQPRVLWESPWPPPSWVIQLAATQLSLFINDFVFP